MASTTQKCKIKVFDDEYMIPFPDVSEHMEIESMKMALTNNRYAAMAASASIKSVTLNLDMVDAISTFSILSEDLKKRWLSGVTLKNIDMKLGSVLAHQYSEVYSPWYDGIMSEINKELEKLGYTTNDKPATAE